MGSLHERVANLYYSIFGVKVSLSTFEERLRFQKFFYTLLHFRVIPKDELYASYYWYLRGPYSVRASDIGHSIIGEQPASQNEIPVPQNLEYLKKINGDIRKIELYASILYLLDHGYSLPSIVVEIIMKKPNYSREEIQEMLAEMPTDANPS
ncbi:MAG: hypothetical protein V1822_04235 [Candidatus Micrarchaeota archaeon]